MHRVADSLRERDRPLPEDVSVKADGQVRIPLAILMADTRVNYVPIDWVADMMAAAVELPPRNATYHFTHHQPPKIRIALSGRSNT
jgi:hypothetical protein